MKRLHPTDDSDHDAMSLPLLDRALAPVVPFVADAKAPAVRIVVPARHELLDENTVTPGELDDTLPFFHLDEQPILTLDQFIAWSIHVADAPDQARKILIEAGAATPNAQRRALGYWQHRIRTDDLLCHRFRALRGASLQRRSRSGAKGEEP